MNLTRVKKIPVKKRRMVVEITVTIATMLKLILRTKIVQRLM
jgi:hypothetical protein